MLPRNSDTPTHAPPDSGTVHATPSYAPPDPDPPPVHPAGFRYRLDGELAHGGMGAVYRATDLHLGREVAVKVLLDRFAPDSGTARRFFDEARITGQLQHPNIPAVHDLGTLPDGRPFLAMKLIKGDTLDDLLKARPDPTADRGRFLGVFEKICEAVAYAHAHDVIHRDLKPQNVMVGAFGEVQVMDWGLAKVLSPLSREAQPSGPDPKSTAPATAIVSQRDSDDLLTQAGSVLGTPAYMAPEQAIGAVDQIDRRTDVFGLGGILAITLTGQPPFVGDTAEDTRQLAANRKLGDCFARLDASGAEPDLVALCKRCLAGEREERPADAKQVADEVVALRAAADERARRAEVDRATAAVRAEEEAKRRVIVAATSRRRLQLLSWAAAVVFTALLAVAAGTTWQARKAWDDADRAIAKADNARAAEATAMRREHQAEDARVAALRDREVASLASVMYQLKLEEARRELAARATHAPNLATTPIKRDTLLMYYRSGLKAEDEQDLRTAIGWYERAIAEIDESSKPEVFATERRMIKNQLAECLTKTAAQPRESAPPPRRPGK